jgi:hypothetical protein
MRLFLPFVILLSALTVQGISVQSTLTKAPTAGAMNLAGRWRVKFTFMDGNEQNLVFDSQAKGSGFFFLVNTAPGDKTAPAPKPAAWSQLSNDRVSFSGEVELPIGTCCRELGTLMFKGKFVSRNSISGKLVFVTSIDEEESPYKFHSVVGTFTATRIL